MAKGKKTGGKNFAPGNNANPGGRPKTSDAMKRIKRLTQAEVERFGNLVVLGTELDLRNILINPHETILPKWFASVCKRGIARGDMQSLNAMLDRLVGKVTDKVQHTGMSLTYNAVIQKLDGSEIHLGAKEIEDDTE